jgi:outer membrane protein OmpA-like peptidoglycan-associated protein
MSSVRRAAIKVRLGAGATAGLLVLSGCSGDTKDTKETPKSPEAKPPAGSGGGEPLQWQPMAHKDSAARIGVLSVDRSAANTVIMRFRLSNDGKEQLQVGASLKAPGSADVFNVGGVTLLDVVNHKRYFPLSTSDGTCVCSSTQGVFLDPGKSLDLYAVYPALSAEMKQVSVTVPMSPAFLNIPVGDKPRPVAAGEIDPSKTTLGQPKILPLINLVDGEEAMDEDAMNRSVRLSADVLFALNKADLTPQAGAVLQRLEKQIETSQGPTVKVDGYADNTGNDAINNPLSERRAKAVADQLKKMVTRQGVTFQSAGHGSADPVAGNDTEEGRKRNRRVTVTFARPKPKPAPPSAPPAPATPAAGGELPVIATVAPTTAKDFKLEVKDFKLEVNSLVRDSSGATVVTFTLTNIGSTQASVVRIFTNRIYNLKYGDGGATGVALTAPSTKLRYYPLRDGDRSCVCTNTDLGDNFLDPQQKVTFGAVYEIPAEVSSVKAAFPGFSESQELRIG